MSTTDAYHAQVALLLRVLPLVDEEPAFALKGGTAINLFVRDLPRLSVDIDLTYLPVQDRTESLAQIGAALRRIAARIRATIQNARVQLVPLQGSGTRLGALRVARGAEPSGGTLEAR